jgi:Domain of unknown function (DUF4082)/Bacterial Ig domain
MHRAAHRSLLIAIAALALPLAAAAQAGAATCSIACENAKPGTPASTWDISGAGSTGIQGFATDMSVNVGSTESFKVKTTARSYRLDIYRMGYYQGNGARKVATVNPSATLPQTQPACVKQSSTNLYDCGNWAVSAGWTVPADAVSGIYFAKLVRTDGSAQSSHIFFVVREDASTSDLLFQTSDTTWQAYNDYGGSSLYDAPQPIGRAYKVSYNRPFNTRGDSAEDFVFNSEYPAVRWLEANGYDVSYTTDVDADRRGNLIPRHKTFMSVGHDEYWSGGQRANVEAARSAGTNLIFMSGNEVFWKTRWEGSTAGPSTAYRTLVTYKETHDNAKIDPNPAWTGSWRDPRFSPPSDGGRPENALTGTIFMVNGPRNDSIKVPAAFKSLRFWRNTSIAGLAAGATKTFAAGTLGYEWDEDLDNGFRPAGQIKLSSATYNVSPDKLLDFGSSFGNGTATHSLTMYRAPSGALVWGAGTVQWPWGLDAVHENAGPAADRDIRQATVNLLAEMRAQPATLQAPLVAAAPSTDTTGPSATITSPASGSIASVGAPVTVSGTATDAGGGVVGGVEVSTDGSAWHPATGTSTWSYTWTPSASGTATLRARATDDSINTGAVSTPVTVNVGGKACPCSIWSASATPANPNESDTSAVELGVKFRSDVAGTITGVRFYKSSQNTGTHIGRLWSRTGTLLASATFSGETSSGWEQVTFASPVPVAANTTYVASYGAPNGHYADDLVAFSGRSVDSPPLHALQSGVDGPNGVWGDLGTFPTNAYSDSNYWVDVVFK